MEPQPCLVGRRADDRSPQMRDRALRPFIRPWADPVESWHWELDRDEPLGVAAGAEVAALAGEGEQVLVGADGAAHAGEAVFQDAAGERRAVNSCASAPNPNLASRSVHERGLPRLRLVSALSRSRSGLACSEKLVSLHFNPD
jgi:hypothetical protein